MNSLLVHVVRLVLGAGLVVGASREIPGQGRIGVRARTAGGHLGPSLGVDPVRVTF
jgi:hypothetical protein